VEGFSAGAVVDGRDALAHATRIDVTEHAASDARKAEVFMEARYRAVGLGA
jgi:hypothetical protein